MRLYQIGSGVFRIKLCKLQQDKFFDQKLIFVRNESLCNRHQLLLRLDALHVGHVDAADHAAAARSQLKVYKGCLHETSFFMDPRLTDCVVRPKF
jgi:hypothetical protein